MCKYSCLDCKNYKPSSTKVVGSKLVDGFMLVPITKEVPAHCDEHPRYFKKWWKENGSKKSDEVTQPKCLDLHEHLKTLGEMINIAKEILEKTKDEKET